MTNDRAVPSARWGVYTYMAGDNDLEGEALADLLEMEVVGSSSELQVVVQIDRAEGFDSSHGDWKGTRRYLVRQGGGALISSELLEDLGETNSGDPELVGRFFKEATARFPAARRALVLWNHGTGFYVPAEYTAEGRGFDIQERARARQALQRTFFASSRQTILAAPAERRGILYDDQSSDCLDNLELARMLADLVGTSGRKIELLGMDACLMNMIEVAMEVAPYVDVLVGSQEKEPGAGWPYEQVLQVLRAEETTEGAARGIVDRYIASYGAEERVTQSAVAVSRLQPLVQALDHLAGSLLQQEVEDARRELFKAQRRSIRFMNSAYMDIRSLARSLRGVSSSADVQAACQVVEAALDDPEGPILATAGAANLQGACGLSIYAPLMRLPSDHYAELAFARATRWGQMLDRLLNHD